MKRVRATAVGLSLLCFTGSGALLALHAQASEDPGSAYYGYTLLSQASGLEVVEDRPTANSHPEGDGEVPLSRVSLLSGPVGYALGTVAWPSALAANAGDLVVFAGNGKVPDSVGPPLDEPVRAETRTGGPAEVTNNTYPGMTMHALVKPAQVAADAVVDGGQAGSASGVGTTETHSKALVESSEVQSTALSTTRDVSLAGGVVAIRSVVSHAQAQSDGTTASASGTTTVTDLTVAGVPVTVDGRGVHVAGNGSAVDTAIVNSALANIGMHIVLSGPTQTKQGATVSYDSGSLIITWKPSADESLTARLGGARVTAGAFLAGSLAALGQPPTAPGTAVVGSTGQPPAVPVVGNPTGAVTVPVGDSGRGTTSPSLAGAGPVALHPLLVGHRAPTSSYVLAALGALLLLGGLLRLPPLVLVPAAAAACPTRRSS